MAVPSIESIAQRIAELAAAAMGKEPSSIDRKLALNSQGVDSLGLAEFIYEVEEAFGVSLSDRDKKQKALLTIDDLAAHIVAQKSAAVAG